MNEKELIEKYTREMNQHFIGEDDECPKCINLVTKIFKAGQESERKRILKIIDKERIFTHTRKDKDGGICIYEFIDKCELKSKVSE